MMKGLLLWAVLIQLAAAMPAMAWQAHQQAKTAPLDLVSGPLTGTPAPVSYRDKVGFTARGSTPGDGVGNMLILLSLALVLLAAVVASKIHGLAGTRGEAGNDGKK